MQIAWQLFIMKCMFIKYDSWMVLDSQTAGEFNVLKFEFDSDLPLQLRSKTLFNKSELQ
jgi:hypothetical protein